MLEEEQENTPLAGETKIGVGPNATDGSDDNHHTKEEIEHFKKILGKLGMHLDDKYEEELNLLESTAKSDGDGKDDDEEEEQDVFDYSAGGNIKQALMYVAAGVLFSLSFALVLLFTGTPQDSDGSVAFQNFLAGYVLELTLSLDNLFAFYLIFKYFKVQDKEAVERTLFWGILGAVVLRAVVVAIGVVAIEQSECVLFLAAIILLWTAFQVFAGEEDDDDDLEDNGIVKFCRRWLPVTAEYDGANFFTRTDEGKLMMTPLMLVNVVINLSDIAFAMDSVPAVFGITDDGLVVWSSSLCAILALRSLYTVTVHYVTDMPYMNKAIGIVLFFIGIKLIMKIMFEVDMPVTLSLLVVFIILSVGFAASYYVKSQEEPEEPEAEHSALQQIEAQA